MLSFVLQYTHSVSVHTLSHTLDVCEFDLEGSTWKALDVWELDLENLRRMGVWLGKPYTYGSLTWNTLGAWQFDLENLRRMGGRLGKP